MNTLSPYVLLALLVTASACSTNQHTEPPNAVAGPELHGLDFDPYEYYGVKPKPLNPNGQVNRL